MSAINRGTKRKEADFYATPLDAVYTLLENYNGISPNDHILEPSAGNGNIIKALRKRGYKNFITAVELREEEKENLNESGTSQVVISDFLQYGECINMENYDVIIGNPPYSMAQEFIDKSLSLLNPGGRLIFLLRTNFLESKKRFEWWQDRTPTRLYVLSKRPSFTGKGTDATSYAWFIWEKTERASTTSIHTSLQAHDFVNHQEIKVI